MSFGAIVILAISLAMDSMAVAAARGSVAERITPRDVIVIATLFGGVHVVMPTLGALAGAGLGDIVQRWDHWLAFTLLGGIGIKMVWESRRAKATGDGDRFGLALLGGLALATGIDALAVGVVLPMMDAPLLIAVATIGSVAAIATVIGLFAGHRFGALVGNRLETVGGLVLVGLGVKILIEHLASGQ